MLRLGRVADLATDTGESEYADRVTLVSASDHIELPALEQQLVRIDLALLARVAFHRVVLEHDRLAPEDRRLDLRQALRHLVTVGGAGDAECDGALHRRVEWARPAPRDLLQREPQRLRVGEFAVEQVQRRPERRQLVIVELDRGEVEVLGRQRVLLLLDLTVLRLLDREHDAEGFELGTVRIKAARERVLVHHAVALDVSPDLRSCHRSPLGHQV